MLADVVAAAIPLLRCLFIDADAALDADAPCRLRY